MAENMIYSDSLGEMVVKGFYVPMKNGEYRHYTWIDSECLYYADDRDYLCRAEVPMNAIMSLKEVR